MSTTYGTWSLWHNKKLAIKAWQRFLVTLACILGWFLFIRTLRAQARCEAPGVDTRRAYTLPLYSSPHTLLERTHTKGHHSALHTPPGWDRLHTHAKDWALRHQYTHNSQQIGTQFISNYKPIHSYGGFGHSAPALHTERAKEIGDGMDWTLTHEIKFAHKRKRVHFWTKLTAPSRPERWETPKMTIYLQRLDTHKEN